jgi:hypothetical protein
MSRPEVKIVSSMAEKQDDLLAIRFPVTDEDDDQPWAALPSRKRKELPIMGPLPEQVDLILGNQIYIPKASLTPSLRNHLIRLAVCRRTKFYSDLGSAWI